MSSICRVVVARAQAFLLEDELSALLHVAEPALPFAGRPGHLPVEIASGPPQDPAGGQAVTSPGEATARAAHQEVQAGAICFTQASFAWDPRAKDARHVLSQLDL